VGREIVEQDMDFAIRMVGDELVHEVEESPSQTWGVRQDKLI
jgi:hypothetical protein